ncbi:PREDICTED: uncharacterized protein LOC104763274 [Camelina sativa]|uniref:Uncharacterized protein LOC104763274 n=1 Tax=Camelina sativa TaxID=90675 RepID=A0ABM0XF08_CAMSA|nr:PREDICTED: uncharacterized protein LOC104763274 [Camelina sativa]
MEQARGNEEDNYRFLSTYLHFLKSTNPGTLTAMHNMVDKKGNALFKYLFFAFGTCISGYQYLRKVIVIDGTSIKGKYKGCLVAASGQDGNMQIFPLAFGVVDGENEGGWVWFFENLKKFVPDEEGNRTTTLALSHFPGDRYNIMSGNISESLNAAMQTAVDYPIVSMVEFLRAMLIRWFYCRRKVANKAKTRCTPEIEEILIDHLQHAVDYRVLSTSEWIYQVNDGRGIVFTVDLQNKTCTCRVFDVLKVPCCHALAARGVLQIDIYTLIGEFYFVEPWRKKYSQIIMSVPKERDNDIPEAVTVEAVNPPRTKRGGGRPKKKRIPSQREQHIVRFPWVITLVLLTFEVY